MMNHDQYSTWLAEQDWYQTMELPSGHRTVGKVRTDLRIPIVDSTSPAGKRVLDIGCNSGQYCLHAKAAGAAEVIGIDVAENRLAQARVLAEQERLSVRFEERSLFDIKELGTFDLVLCFAVLTEVQDLLGAVEAIRPAIGSVALFEIGLAGFRPTLNMRNWRERGRYAEYRQTKSGMWVAKPSLALLADLFGAEFTVSRRGRGLRYPLVVVARR